MQFQELFKNIPNSKIFALTKIYETTSKVSGIVQVYQQGNERKLVVGGATQSIYRTDESSRGYWGGLLPENKVDSVLLLGLGGGTVTKILRKKWPDVQIIAYELDPVIVKVARALFNLDKKIEIRIADARKSFLTRDNFDLVIVDLYLGNKLADFTTSPKFIKGVAKKLNSPGFAVFNRIPTSYNDQELRDFDAVINSVFKESWAQKADLNLVFWGKK